MQQLFTITRQNRKLLYSYLNNLSEHDLFTVPKGFNNNIWWNIAHVVVTEQKLIYALSELRLNISQKWVNNYQKGTFPEGKPDKNDVSELKTLLFDLPEQTINDYENGRFTHFNSYMTSPKVELNTIEDAIAFNVFHEGLHLGSIMALARAVKL
ncbi:MAG: DinB family protein [Croceivirga sp.]